MTETKMRNFNTEPLIKEIEGVIKNGVEQILNDFLNRYDLLEKTHEQIMNLPSVQNEINKKNYNDEDEDDEAPSMFVSIKDMTHDLVKEELSSVENKLSILEEKYNNISPLLDTILNKIQSLGVEIASLKIEQPNKTEISSPLQVASSTNVNENIKLEIEDTIVTDELVVDGEVEEDEGDDEEEEEEEEESDEEESDEEEEEVDVVSYEKKIEPEKEDEVETEEEEEVDDESIISSKQEIAALTDVTQDEKEEEEELMELEIDDITYCTNNEENGFIYELNEDGEVGDKVGYLKEGEPFFYADEK